VNVFFWKGLSLLGVRSSFLALRPMALKICLFDVRAFQAKKKQKERSFSRESNPGTVDGND